jgi:predicted ATPase
VTFLFTDIEGSTRRWESDATEMRVALAAHDKVLRSAIDAQRELELPVRMGIATGEAEFRDNDYFGTVLNRAARVMAAGHGGQILVADSTAGLIGGVELMNLGPRLLRDVASPVTVFQVQAQGLCAEFPPLRTLDASPGNLKPAGIKLIGRDRVVRDLVESVRSSRLVTLTGVGGVGKTSLALDVARQMVDEFPDGVWVFELAAAADAAVVPEAVAAVLGVTQKPGISMAESVASALEGRIRLLVFDNCEHILDAAADLIDGILAQSSTVRILATSREPLDVATEQIWPVRSLDGDAAADLFIERARSVAPGFFVDNVDAVREICQRLDGIPLAIDLAASRISSMSLDDVQDRLDRRFKLLVGSRRRLERHQTLRHAVQWSYDLLDDAEKALLERCSVFAGGFETQSACAVSESDDADDFAIVDGLHSLVRKSLLVVDRESGRTRLSMLETIRQFAEEQLAVHGNASDSREAHARHFAHRETDVMALWDSPRQREAYEWFALELANLRNAFRWAADNRHLDDAAAIATYTASLGFFVENFEPVSWAAELIETARTVNHPRFGFLCAVATGCWFVGRVEEAIGYSDLGDAAIGAGVNEIPYGMAAALHGPYLAIGQPDRAVERCRVLIDRAGHAHVTVRSFLAICLTIAGREDEAMATTVGLVEAAEMTHNPYIVSNTLMAFGFAWRSMDPDGALEAMHRGLAIAHATGNRFNESHLAANLAQLDVEREDRLSALDHITLAIRYMHDSGNIVTVRSPMTNLAIFLDRLGHYEAAATIAGFAFSPLTVASFPKLEAAMAHLRKVLGDAAYEALAHKGASMTTSAMATYAYEEVDKARAELERST